MPARWMHDDETEYCLQCSAEFSTLRRKHHCRACGKIYCDDCSQQKLLVPRDQLVYPRASGTNFFLTETDPCEPQRVCYPCSRPLMPIQDELRKTMSKASQSNFINRDSVERYMNSPIQFTLDAEIRKAAYTLYNFTGDNAIEGADTIPRELIWGAKGLAFLTIVKAGFFFTGRLGTGLVIGRLEDGTWSAPSAICCTGVGWGFQLGGEVTDVIIVLNSSAALQAFASRAQVSLGTELSVSLGPLGRTAATDVHAGEKGITAAFSYAHSKGFFVGVSLEAALIVTRPDVNEAFYGMRTSTPELLSGRVPRPKAGDPLYQALREVMGDEAPGYESSQFLRSQGAHHSPGPRGDGYIDPPEEQYNRWGGDDRLPVDDRAYEYRSTTRPNGHDDDDPFTTSPNGVDGLYDRRPNGEAGGADMDEWAKERSRRLSSSREIINDNFGGKELNTIKPEERGGGEARLVSPPVATTTTVTPRREEEAIRNDQILAMAPPAPAPRKDFDEVEL